MNEEIYQNLKEDVMVKFHLAQQLVFGVNYVRQMVRISKKKMGLDYFQDEVTEITEYIYRLIDEFELVEYMDTRATLNFFSWNHHLSTRAVKRMLKTLKAFEKEIFLEKSPVVYINTKIYVGKNLVFMAKLAG